VVDALLGIYLLFLIKKSDDEHWKPYIALMVAIILDFIITILIVISSNPLEYMMYPGIIFAKGIVSVIYAYFFYHILLTIINKNKSEAPAASATPNVSAASATTVESAAPAPSSAERYRHALSRKFKL